jgi:hypothetical protein
MKQLLRSAGLLCSNSNFSDDGKTFFLLLVCTL